MKYYELPESTHFSCSFPIGNNVYRAEFRTLSGSKKQIWTVRDQEGNELFKNIYAVTKINYADLFGGFPENVTLGIVVFEGKRYVATEG